MKLKEHPPGSKADVAQTIIVGLLVLLPLPVLVVAVTFAGGPLAFFSGIGLGLWGAIIGRHLLEAFRDGAAAYGYAKADRSWAKR